MKSCGKPVVFVVPQGYNVLEKIRSTPRSDLSELDKISKEFEESMLETQQKEREKIRMMSQAGQL